MPAKFVQVGSWVSNAEKSGFNMELLSTWASYLHVMILDSSVEDTGYHSSPTSHNYKAIKGSFCPCVALLGHVEYK